MPSFARHDETIGAARTDVAIAIILRGGRVLICQRLEGASFAGYWEFPGGKRERDETLHDCLAREVREELAIGIHPVAALRPIDHDYPRGQIRLHPFVCTLDHGEPRLLACQAARWIEPQDLKAYQFPPANEALIDDAIAFLMRPPPQAPDLNAAR